MSHWAEIDENNIVLNVLVGNDEEPDEGESFMKSLSNNRWIKTSYNTYGGVHQNGGTPLRMNYAQINGHYDELKDAFYSVQPYPSWTLNQDTYLWEPPVAYPTDGLQYVWNEETQNWVEFTV
jgi:hypothetical protein